MFGELILLLFVALAVIFLLFGLAVYYLFTNQYSSISLIIPAIIFSSVVTYTTIRYSLKDALAIFSLLGLPVTYLGAFYDSSKVYIYLFIILGVIINYFVVFGIINFLYQMMRKIF